MKSSAVKSRLTAAWKQVLNQSEYQVPDPELDRFVHSSIVSLRYAVVTQLLGKWDDPTRDLLCLQKGDATGAAAAGRWDPRSFCKEVVVPWVQAHDHVLGTSTDPYVNKPLRRPRLDAQMESLRHVQDWKALVAYLQDLEAQSDAHVVHSHVFRCLASVARRLSHMDIRYPVPMRISLARLCTLLQAYTTSTRGGLRPQVTAVALMRTVGRALSLWTRVESQGLNETDMAQGRPGDITCWDPDDSLRLVVEVKGRMLTLADMESTVQKARLQKEAPHILFTVPGLAESSHDAIEKRMESVWASGLNVHHISLTTLIRSVFVLIDEHWRVTFLHEIGTELNQRASDLTERRDWSSLLRDL